MARITIDNSDFLRYERELGEFAKRAVPFATRNTLNTAAFTTMKVAKDHVTKKMTLRAPNNWTRRSIQVNKARSLNPDTMRAFVGSTLDYMEEQEFGGIKTAKGKQGTPITTSYASGEGENTKKRRKLARRPNKLKNIQLRKSKRRGKNRKQRNIIAIAEAAKAGRRYVYLDFSKHKGIFRLKGSLRKGAKSNGGKYNPELKMVQDLSNKSVRIPRNPWLKPSVDKVVKAMPLIHLHSLQEQVKRQQIFQANRYGRKSLL